MRTAEELPAFIFAEQDDETGEKRWFSIKGMGVEYVRASDAVIALSVLQDEITRLRSELANARNAALEEAAKLIAEGFDRPGIAKKQDTCPHGKFGWEDCEQCAVLAIRGLKAEGESR